MERGEKRKKKAKNKNESRSQGKLPHETQSSTQNETRILKGLFQSHGISWVAL